jgi:hypothetical protein
MMPYGVKEHANDTERSCVAVSNGIRRQLVLLAGSRRTRTSVFSAARPTHWEPASVRRPDSGEAFTPDGAWTFVAELLERGVDVEAIVLEKPPGRTGYVVTCDGWAGEEIYIKLELCSGMVVGRSFHVSTR